MNTSFFGEMLQSITERGRALIDRKRNRRESVIARSEDLAELCDELLSGRGEASGVALAREILTRYGALTTGPRIALFEALATRFGPDLERIEAAVEAWSREPSDATAAELHAATEPRRQELFRRLNLAPGGTAALVAMREDLLDALVHRQRPRRSRCRFRAAVLHLVQPGIPGAAPYRLVDAGHHSREDHPLRGRA